MEDWIMKFDGETHWAADDLDFSKACDLGPDGKIEITCVFCLTMLVEIQQRQIKQLRHRLNECDDNCDCHWIEDKGDIDIPL